MVTPDFRDFKSELYHYGMPQRSGRYPYGSGDRPYQRFERKAQKMETRLRKRLDKADETVKKKQKLANYNYEQAVRKSNSLFSSKKSARRSLNKATKYQRRVQLAKNNAVRHYRRVERFFDKKDITMDEELKKRGLEYYDKVVNNPKNMYQMVLMISE